MFFDKQSFFLSQRHDLWIHVHWGVICHWTKPLFYLKLQKWCYVHAMTLESAPGCDLSTLARYQLTVLFTYRAAEPIVLSTQTVSGSKCPLWLWSPTATAYLYQIKSKVTDRPLSVCTPDEARGFWRHKNFFCFIVALLCSQAITGFL